MQAEARHAGATWTGQRFHTFRIDPIPGSRDAAPGIGAERHLARYGGRVEARQPRLIDGERIRLFGIAVGSQATTLPFQTIFPTSMNSPEGPREASAISTTPMWTGDKT